MNFKKLALLMLSWLLLASTSATEVRIALSSAPNNLSPFYSTDANSQNINRLVHLSLVDFNANMQFQCIACETFSERMEKEKHILVFKLKPDLTFSDGEKITTQSVVQSWKYYAKDEKINSTFKGAFEVIEDIRVKDALNFEIVYKTFSLENLSNLSLLKIVKLKTEPTPEIDALNVIGAGPYVLSEVSPLDIKIVPRAQNKPIYLFKVVKDETTLALKLINNEIDLSVANMSPRKVAWLKEKAKDLHVYERESGNFLFLGMNHKKEFLQDRRTRQALSHLIPREDILKYKLKNTAILATSMFSKAFADMYQERVVDNYDPKLAHSLLAEVGFKKNKSGLYEKNGQVFEIDWKVSNNKASIEIVEVIKNYFEKEGIKVTITIQEWGTFMSNFKSGKFDMVISQWVGFTGPEMLRFVFHSENVPPKGGNRISFINKEFDQAVDLATLELDAKKRIELYKKAESIVNREYAYINLWHPNVVWVGKKCLGKLDLEPNASFNPLLKMEPSCGK